MRENFECGKTSFVSRVYFLKTCEKAGQSIKQNLAKTHRNQRMELELDLRSDDSHTKNSYRIIACQIAAQPRAWFAILKTTLSFLLRENRLRLGEG